MQNKHNKLELVRQIVRDSRKRKNIPSLLSFVLISLLTSLTILIFTNLALHSDYDEPVTFIFRPSVAGDVIIRTIPTECSGWENPELAKNIDLLGSSPTKDFTTKNSASYTNNPYENLGEVAEFELANAKLVCSGFQLAENIPPEATDIVGTINFSFATDTFEGNEDIVVFAYTLDGGKNWESIDSFALLEEMNNQTREGYWSYPITDLNELKNSKDFKIRVQYVSEPNDKPATAYVDGIALDIKYYEDRKNKEGFAEISVTDSLGALTQIAPVITVEVEKHSTFEFLGVPSKKRGIKSIQLTHPDGSVAAPETKIEKKEVNGIVQEEYSIEANNFDKPGVYKATFAIEEKGIVEEKTKEFAWGVLSLNTSKSVYLPDETANLSISAFNRKGNFVCDADLSIQITDPRGKIATLTTNDEIFRSPNCGPKIVTNNADYITSIDNLIAGKYILNLSGTIDGELYSTIESFSVEKNLPFDITRIAPSRVYPIAEYEMFLEIIPKEDYFGAVTELVPNLIDISAINENGSVSTFDEKNNAINWHVDWKKGEAYTLSYKFESPALVDYHFQLGPVSFNNYNSTGDRTDPLAATAIWTEQRPWQIESDSIADKEHESYSVNGRVNQIEVVNEKQLRFREEDGKINDRFFPTNNFYQDVSNKWHTIETSLDIFNQGDSSVSFNINGKPFILRPAVVIDGTTQLIDNLPSNVRSQLQMRLEVQKIDQGNKWSHIFFRLPEIEAIEFLVESENHIITNADPTSLVVDEQLLLNFSDLVASGFKVTVTPEKIRITNLNDGWNILDPTDTFYSTAAADGEISYGTVYGVSASGTTSRIGLSQATSPTLYYRSYLSFDTSALPDSATISASDVNTYAESYSKTKALGTSYPIDYYSGLNAIGAALDSGDWNNCSTAQGSLDWAGSVGWKSKSLTSPDSAVSKTGDTDFRLIDGFTDVGATQYKLAVMRQTEYADTTSDPFLDVTYTTGISVSGNVYNENSATALTECDGVTNMINLRVQSTTYSTTCNDSTGAFTFTGVATPSSSEAMIIWIEGQTPDGATVNLYSASGDVTGMTVQENSVTIHNDSGLTTPDNADLDVYDNGNDDDINYTVTTNALTVEDGHRILVKTNESYTPGGAVTTSPAATQSAMDGDVYLETGASLTMGTNALSIGGDFTSAGTVTISLSATQTTTFTGNTTGFAIEAEDAFQNLVFNGTGGGWDFDQDATVSGDITMTAGTLSGTDNIAVSGGDFSGTSGDVNMSGGTVTLSGTGSIGANTNWDFNSLTITGDTTTTGSAYFNVNGTLTVSTGNELTIDTGDMVWSTSAGTVTIAGTLNGSGSLLISNSNLGTGGTLSSAVTFSPPSTTITAPARTYGGDVTIQNNGTTQFASGTLAFSANLYINNGESIESATLDAATNDPTVTIAGDLDNTAADGSTTLQLGAGTWTVEKNVDFSGITSVTYDTGNTIIMSGTGNLSGADKTLYNLTINGNGNTVTTTTNTIVANTLTIGGAADANNDTLSINTGVSVTSATAGTVTLVGSGTDSITGAGTLVVKNSNLTTSGTISSIVRFDVTNGGITMPARTYSGTVEAYSNSALSSNTVTIGAGTHNISGSLYLLANNTTPITLSGLTNNPTVNITGDLDYTGGGAGTETLVTGNAIWTVGGNIDFTSGSTTISTGNTLKMNGTSKSITSAAVTLQNFEISGGSTTQVAALDVNGTFAVSSGGFTQAANHNLNIAGNFTLSTGTTFTPASGSGILILDGDLTLNDGTSPKQDLGNVHIGTSPDTTDLASDFAAKSLTVNIGDVFNTNGYDVDINTGGISISGTFDATDDVETDETTINCAGSFSINSGATFTADQSTLIMDAGSGTSDLITDGAFSLYNLTIADGGGSLTVEVEDALDVNNNVTITGGNLDGKTGEGNAITVGGNWDNDDTYTAQGNTVTFDAPSGTKTIDADGTGTDAFYDLTFNDAVGSAHWDLTGTLDVDRNFALVGGTVDNSAGSYNINIGGGWDNDDDYIRGTETVTFDATSGTNLIDADGTGNQDFYHVIMNDNGGTATWQLTTNWSWIDGDFTLTDGTLDFNNFYLYINGNFNKTNGALQMNQASDYLLVYGTFTISGADGTNVFSYGTIQVQDDFTISGDNTFIFGGAGGPRVVFTGTKDPTISISGANNTIGSSSIGAYFDIAFTNSTNTLTFLTDVNAGHCRAMEGKLVINGQNVRFNGVYYGYSGSGIDMASGSVVVGRESYSGGGYSPWYWEGGATENISGGTIQVYGSAHATYGTAYFGNGSNFTPTGGTFQFMGTATASIYIAEVDVADFNFWHLTLGDSGTKTVEVHISSATPVDVDGDLTISTGATFDTNTEPVEVAGSWTNSGTFTADSGTVTLNGSSTQTISGTLTGTSSFYDLTITNSSGSYTGCDTAFTPGVDFAASATATNNYTITTGNVKVEYNSGSTYTFNNINWAGTLGNEIIFRNSNLTSGTWLLVVTGTQTDISYVSVARSDATGGDTIVASNGTNTNCGSNIEWIFSTFSVAGNVYNVNTTTALTECDGSTNMVNLRVQSTTYQTFCNDSTGAYTFSAVTTPTTNEAMIIWIDGQTPDGTTVNKYSGSGNVTGIIVEENALTIHNDSAVAVSNTDLDTYDNGNDDDIIYTVTTSNLTVEDGHRIIVKTNENFTPGGTVTTSPSATQTDMDGDIYLETGAVLAMETNALSIGGDFISAGTVGISFSAGQTTTFTGTTTGFIIEAEDAFQTLTFNGSGGGWTFDSAVTINDDLNVTAGTITLGGVADIADNVTINGGTLDVKSGNNYAINVAGSWDIDSGVFEAQSGTVTFDATITAETIDPDGTGADAFYDLTFNDGGGSAQWTLTGALDVNHNLSIVGGNLYNTTGSYNINVGGGWDNDDTYTCGTETVTFDASSGTHSIDADGTGTESFYNTMFNDGGGSAIWQLTTLMDVNNDFTITGGNFDYNGSNTLTVAGNFTNSDTVTESTGTLTMDGTSGTKTINVSESASAEAADFYNITFNDAGGPTTFVSPYPLDIDNNLLISGGSLDMEEAQTYYLTSSTTNALANNRRLKTVDPAGAADSNSLCSDANSNQSDQYCVLIPGNSSAVWGSEPSTIQQKGYMLSDNRGISGTYAAGNWTVNATATQSNGQFTYSGYRLHARLWKASTTLSSASAITGWTYAAVTQNTTSDVTITFSDVGETTLTDEVLYVEFAAYFRGSAIDFGSGTATTLSLTVNEGGTKQKITTPSFAPQINVAGNWDNDDIFYHTGGTVVFDPVSGTKTINSTGATEDDFYNLIINDGVATSIVQLAGTNLQVDNNFTLTEGSFDLNNLDALITGNFTKTAGNLLMDQAGDHINVSGNLTVSGDGGSSALQYGSIVVGGDVSISNNNVFQMGNNTGYPVFSMYGAVSKTITVSGTGNYFGTTSANGEFDIDKTGGAVVNVGSDLDIWNLVHNTGGLNIDSNFTVDIDGQYVGFGGVLTMTNGTLSVGSDNLAPSSLANFYVASGWTEAISAGTIEVDGAGHATNEAVYFANGSNFTPTGGTFKMIGNDNSTIEVAEINAVDFNFYNLTIGDGTNTKTVDIDAASATSIDINDILIDTNATFDTNSEPVYIGGNWNNNGTFTADSGTVTFNGSDTDNTIDAGTGSFYNIAFVGADGSGTWTIQNDSASVTNGINVDANDIVSINTGISTTWTGSSFTLDGTISGVGTLIIDSATVIPTTGTLTCTVRFDATNGNTSVIPARTYGSIIEPYNSSSVSARTIVLGTAGSQTITISGWLYPMAEGTQNVTLSATDYNPTVNIIKSLEFTGTGSGTEIIQSGTGTWNVSGIVDFTDGTYTAGTGNTLRMNGASKTITSAGQSLQNFVVYGGSTTSVGALDVNGTFTVSSGQFIQGADVNLNVAGDFTLANGTTFTAASGTGKLYLDGDLTLTDDTLNKQDLGDLNIGTSPDTTELASDILAKGITINSGDVLNSHGYDMTIGVYGLNVIGSLDLTDDVEMDETFITTDGDVTFGATSSVTEDQSTVTFDAASGTDNIFNPGAQNFHNLVINGASLTVEVEDPIFVYNDLTITNGTLDVVSGENNQISLAGDWTNNGTFTARNGTLLLNGSSTQNMSATMTTTSQFYNLTISNSSGSYSGCATSFTPGIDFAASATIGGTYTITTGDAKIEYNSGSTYTANNINWNGGAYGDEIIFRNSNLSSGTWTLDVSGTQTAVKYVDVGRSDASSGDTIDARHISNVDCSNTTNWEFDSITLSISDTTIGFGDLTSANARWATGDAIGSDSKISAHTITAYTAADNGYLLTYYGPLLTSSSDTITAATITNDDDGAAGTEQFGLGITTTGDCTINTDYNANSPAEYKYVASTTTTLCSETVPTSAEVISAYYIANIGSDTEAGSYSTDITYIMSATF